ncbi:DinB family protein [Devosia sp. A16]|uniref:DinB family protein n=1 Tax=Devosia sp. A16 TaxID=1736675 RepID=UPI0006D7819C|nr:DinB family protein [Devosia sp. A16]
MTVASRIMRKLAQNNHLANHRLLTACFSLQPGEFEAKRVSFFPSLKATLNHIVTIDWFYVDALEGGTLGPRAWDPEEPFDAIAPLAEAQFAVDRRLLAFCTDLTDARLAAQTRVHRTNRIQVERTDDLLLHLFMHQTHHRGQVHAMLAGSSVQPPQLDEFLTASDFRDRAEDMAALGWSEAELGA